MITRYTRIPAALLSIYYMLRFSLPKLQASEKSLTSFTAWGEQLHINGTAFMYFTGTVELLIVIALTVSLIVSTTMLAVWCARVGCAVLFATLAGAMAVEFGVRPEPVPRLVIIAIVLLAVSVLQLVLLRATAGIERTR